MNKQAFLAKLRKGLSGLPQADIEERLSFYSEMIEDRMEEGLSEEEAVSAVESVDEIAAQTIADIPPIKRVKEKTKQKKQRRVWETVLLVLGLPIWFSLAVAALAVVILLYVSVWSVIISLWAVFGSFVGCALGGIVAGLVFACSANVLTGIATVGAGIACAGLSVFLFYGCKAATKGVVIFTKKLALRIKNCFIKKEEA